MLTGRKLVFIGGDARQIEVIAQTTELDASATLIGFEKMTRTFTDTQHGELCLDTLATADALVLPVAGMDDDGIVDSKFSDATIRLTEEHFAALRSGTFVFSGIARTMLTTWTNAYGLHLVRLMELDEVAILNSIPTAEGAVALAMQHTDFTIHGATVVVLGFGRCGQTLARTLWALGADVRVVARQGAHLARIREMGMTPYRLEALEQAVQDANIVFNSVPTHLLTAGVLQGMPRECVIIDIASKPGGTDFRYAERRGMKALLAPSLPGLVAPKTAGRIIASSLSRILAESEITSEIEGGTPWR